MTPRELVKQCLEAEDAFTFEDVFDALVALVHNAQTAERARCYQIAFEAVATTKDGLHVKASIADAIACGEFEAALR